MNLQEKIKDFDNRIKIGTDVLYKNDFGEYIQTKTRSRAWEVAEEGIVLLNLRTGGVNIDRVSPIVKEKK